MERKIEPLLEKWYHSPNRKPLILNGARQVGKTYALKKFAVNQRAVGQVHYIDFEKDPEYISIFEKDVNPKRIVEDLNIVLRTRIDTQNDVLILDEIQRCPRALTSLKYFYEEMSQLAICSAGSLLGVELHESSFPVGKVEFLDMFPMSFAEFLLATDQVEAEAFLQRAKFGEEISDAIHSVLWDSLKIYFVTGGLPEAVSSYAKSMDDKVSALLSVRELQSNLIRSYVADMAKHAGKQNAMHLERLWSNVAFQLGSEVEESAPKFTFKNVIPGVKGYDKLAGAIDWLVKAGLVLHIPIVNKSEVPLAAYSKLNAFKLFLFDIGILGAIARIDPREILSYDYGSYKGYFAENFVLQEMISSGMSEAFCWKEGRSEVEFLFSSPRGIVPVEVKAGRNTKTRSLSMYRKKYLPATTFVLSGKNENSTTITKQETEMKLHKVPLYFAHRLQSD